MTVYSLLFILLCTCILCYSQNVRNHDFSSFDIRLKLKDYGRRSVQDPTFRKIRERIDQKLQKFNSKRRLGSENWEIVLHNERSIDEIRYILGSESKDVYEIEETYKNNTDYIRYMNQRGISSVTYHSYTQLQAFLQEKVSLYPTLVSQFTIGTSKLGRDLIGLRINTPAHAYEEPGKTWQVPLQKPKFKYVGNMHGDETVGREILIQFIDYLLTEYQNTTNTRIKKLLDSVDLYILPSMNPDGYELRQRTNANGIDLNRNFPDQFIRQMESRQSEVTAIINWIANNTFVLSANFHGGAVVANYPWDGLSSGRYGSGYYSKSPDDALFIHLSKSYANNHKTMTGRTNPEFPTGITNGAMWYTLYGGMQDYNYIWGHTPEITVELSNIKRPPENQLEGFWDENKEALLAYMENIYRAIAGSIVVYPGGKAIDVACNITFSSSETSLSPNGDYSYLLPIPARDAGFYYKVLLPATYNVTLSCDGYIEKRSEGLIISMTANQPVIHNWIVSKIPTCVPNC